MRRTAQGALALSVGILVLSLASSYGWGDNADRLVTNKAVDTLPDEMLPFFQANRQFLVQHVTQDDPGAEVRYANITPISSGWIITDPSLSLLCRANITPRWRNSTVTNLEMYGLLPWEIGFYSKKLTDAFRDHNWAEAKIDAAILAHYVNAAHDPFNTTHQLRRKTFAAGRRE